MEKNIKNNNTKSFPNVSINWYPGHMVKAQNEIKENLKLMDIVVEVLDARIPISSANPKIEELAENKARIVVLNKADLADEERLEVWEKKFKEKGYESVICDSSKKGDIDTIVEKIKVVGKRVYEKKYANKGDGFKIKPIYRVLIAGIPNVGKSTIINKIAGRVVAGVGNKPGVTKEKKWIRVSENIDLLDTPGLLWPKLDDNNAGIKLALTGNIKEEILDLEELAIVAINYLLENEKYKKNLIEKYRLSKEDLELESYEILEVIGRKKGCLVAGGNVDLNRASKMFLDDLKSGKIGRISLE